MNASTPATTVDPREAAHFGAMAADWWNPAGSSAMLHRLNPVRLRYLRGAIDRHWGLDPAERRPLTGRRAVDVGCGAGLLCEPLARLGAVVTGIEPAPESVAAARAHAAGQGLAITYREGSVDQLGDEPFDLIVSLEVVEHVADPAAYVTALAGALAKDGLLILSTPNRTALSRLALIGIGETVGGIPPGTHDWDRFLTPEELSALLTAAALKVVDVTGLGFSPTRGFTLGDDRSLNYLLTATHAGPALG
ncbi:bifunctional 2-polyprenyl-6-hydroxyphenol methylase/3-demethylubiquinol 3-O-methyltransferase UbiG [Sphingomonas flavalba]|uniref:bifunctional 2-polyprenyl-6-hydroxyphenol methylase/3-demethylubiquinol 3-O-methyltransferase UbiG n=1 Tax=Sphingomonas flavalba TaxID=2559804 RepID=UPI00109E0675|nr:bifunctional 2-polyprenyl-6-hydroxyphenol methylase/3-demethylubiquinol 3-O-methyltransferase UbiG [Sphingomonas flavalba]